MKKKGLTFAILLSLLTFAISLCIAYVNKYFIIGDYVFKKISTDEVELNGVNDSIKSACLSPTISHKGVTYRLTSIGDNAFYNCFSLTSVTIGNSATSIGNSTFEGCSSLTSITIPESVTSIGYATFLGCSSLASITIPESVTSIGYYAFSDCSSLASITIPESVMDIGGGAFSDCSSLASITIPESVMDIGGGAFSGCSSMTSMVVESGNSTYDSRDNCNAIIETATNTLIAGCQNTTIPNSVTSIGDWAFYGCSSLTAIDYVGTRELWEKIEKSEGWNENSNIQIIRCTDGEIVL